MIRKPRNPNHRLKAYYVENEQETVFWCKVSRLRNITNEMGQSLPLSNGEQILETESPLKFKMNQNVRIGNELLLIQNDNGEIDSKDLNSMRGKPSFTKFVLVR